MAELLSSGLDPVAFHARFRPEATACVDLASGASYTYRRLSAEADACAGRLVRQLGNVRGERIAVVSRNSALLAVITIACDRAGAIFVPLNWRLTATELAVLLEDCEPALILRQEEFAATVEEAAQLADCHAGRAPLEEAALTADRGDTDDVDAARLAPAAFGEPSILLYTSGTTGRPKGVIVTRRIRCCYAIRRCFTRWG
jgi:fatty-acyl-CoA synthase